MEYQLYAHVYDISHTYEEEIEEIEDNGENVFRSPNLLVDVTEMPERNIFKNAKYMKSVPILDSISMADIVNSIFDSYDEPILKSDGCDYYMRR